MQKKIANYRLLFAGALAFAITAVNAASANTADEAVCDRLAAAPFDSDRPAGTEAAAQIAAKDIQEAVRACEEAARSPGSPRRMWLQYGRALEFAGRSADALSAYEKAAGQGSTMAMVGLSDLYSNGSGTAQNYPKALGWLQKAAAAGNAAAMNNLAAMYGTGEGVDKDFAQARQWYEKSAAAGFAEAMYQLGRMAQDGDGVPKDDAAAKAWFEKAANQDHPEALYSLGLLAAQGRAGPKDKESAKRFFARAVKLGSEDAAKALHQLSCPFKLKNKDGKNEGEICFDGPVPEIRPKRAE